MVLATHAGSGVTAALRPELAVMVDDLRDRLAADSSTEAAWRAQHKAALTARRSATSWTDWCTDLLTQAAVGWVLGTVFVRFCEDNRLLGGHPGSRTHGVWITSNDRDRRQQAMDAERVFYQTHSDLSYREWLETAYDAFRREPATKELVGDHSAIHILKPSSDAVNRLLTFWRRTDDNGDLLWDFTDPELTTRFLGDLYQDLSDYAKNKYALLQTPDFVEEFIVDQTMEPALKDRPLQGFKMIDPTCGSGHFLLGAFRRLLDRWDKAQPGLEPRTLVQRALDGVYGVDLNPFAVAIARFRLIVAALEASGDTTLIDAPGFDVHVAVGDSLLHGESQYHLTADDETPLDDDLTTTEFSYRTEDLALLRGILVPGSYDVVVGNPPYIVARDKALNERYRELYTTCKGKYALTVPFMERFFQLAKTVPSAGWVGQITSNSFMKREFGVPLIESFLPQLDLRLIIDTSGAYIPGHGTPTVIIVGRNQRSISENVKTVLGIRGEPGRPTDASKGLVWSTVVRNLALESYEDEMITVAPVPRRRLRMHPWSLSGGASAELLETVTKGSAGLVGLKVESIGFSAITGQDEAFIRESSGGGPQLPASVPTRRWIVGESVRDYQLTRSAIAVFPYTPDAGSKDAISDFLWPVRTNLANGIAFGQTRLDRGQDWWEYILPNHSRLNSQLLLTFAFVATHNHFVLDRGGKVFNQSAPVIKMPMGATVDDHLRLMGILNSSITCFWLKQNSHLKGGSGIGRGIGDEAWEQRYEFTGTTLQDLPLPSGDALERARLLDTLAQQLSALDPEKVVEKTGPHRDTLARARSEAARIRSLMIAQQEELDWEVFRLYGLVDEDLTYPDKSSSDGANNNLSLPGISLGERAFEITLARKIAIGAEATEWFARHESNPITEIPDWWPADYRKLVQRRLDLIESDRFINLLERPEYKRRWQSEPWSVRLTRALRDHLLDRLEDRWLWFTEQGMPQPRSVAQIADLVETAHRFAGFTDALDMWVGHKGAPTAQSLATLLEPEGVPYLAALRYKESGLRKRAEWESVWEAQRAEDAGIRDPKTDPVPVPPKYTGADFVKQSYWSHRGKLDVPKERFISYPGAGRLTDPSMLLGWAGWNHAEQGLALGRIFTDREAETADPQVLTPLIAGVAEVLPWVKQWHSGIDPELGIDLGEYLDGQIDSWCDAVGVAREDLPTWRPPATTRGRRSRTAPTGPAAPATTYSTAAESPTDVQVVR